MADRRRGSRKKIEWSVTGGCDAETWHAVVLHVGPVKVWLPWQTAREVGKAMVRKADQEQRSEASASRLIRRYRG